MSVYVPVELRKQIRSQFDDRCAYCQTAEHLTPVMFEIEHIMPECYHDYCDCPSPSLRLDLSQRERIQCGKKNDSSQAYDIELASSLGPLHNTDLSRASNSKEA